MEITLLIHMEAVIPNDGTNPKVVFWAQSEDAPGFYAAADHLKELLELSTDGLKDQLGEDVTILAQLVKEETTQGPPVRYQQQVEGMDTPLVGPPLTSSDSMSRTLSLV